MSTLKDLQVQALDYPVGGRPALSEIPNSPGVYLHRDIEGRVLYVGKARSLRQRVSSYFNTGLPTRTVAMVAQARRIEWVVVGGEVQALLLEYSLIQQHKPRYNVRYRDDKSYPYLAVTLKDEWPKATVMRGKKRRGIKYYGPFAHAYAIRETMDSLTRVFPMRTCSESLFNECKRLNRPCLYFHIGRCPGPCVGECTTEQYRESVNSFTSFLDGDVDPTLKRLEAEMLEASERMDFEHAARRRDQLSAARRVLEKQEVVAKSTLDADVIGVAADDLDTAVQVFFVRGGRIAGRKGFVAEVVEEQTGAQRLTMLLESLYMDAEDIPPEVLVPEAPEDAETLEAWLSQRRGRPVRIRVARTGERAGVLATVTENAGESLRELRMKRRADLNARSRALSDLQDALGLPEAPLRIECFDISHLQGQETVASMVVFEDGLPRPADYRKFRVQTVAGIDDFASMHEVVGRRFARYVAERDRPVEAGQRPRKFAYRPQLVLIDGGRGQLGAAMRAMQECGIDDIPVASLAKRLEEVYVPGQPEPIRIARTSEALYVLQHIRDEAHRFAVSFHRQRRDKRMTESALDDMPGIGKTRKQALLSWFGSVEAMTQATPDELRAVNTIPRALADEIYKRLHP